ncbi:hypothetical protein HG531_007351 [Fusarium graminearum]|nr:hypothetical protein HG531_007351 [Fusarium graminearum]
MLMMNIVVFGVVTGNELKRVPWESVATVVVDSLDCRHGEEQDSLAKSHASNLECDGSTESIEEESLNRVVVESTVGPLVDVHQSVEEVLPSIDDGGADKVLNGGYHEVVNDLGKCDLPRRESRFRVRVNERRVVTTSDCPGQQGMGIEKTLGDGGSIEADETEESWESSLGNTNAGSPNSNVILALAYHFGGFRQGKECAGNNLDDLLHDNITSDFITGDDVDGVECERQDPVDDDREQEVEPKVGDPGQEVRLDLEAEDGQRR